MIIIHVLNTISLRIMDWLLGFGAKTRVLEPLSLGEEISEEARALLDQYKAVARKRPMAQAPIRARNLSKGSTSFTSK